MSKRRAGLSLILAASLLLTLSACGQATKTGEAQQGERGKTIDEMLQDQSTIPAGEGNGDRDSKNPDSPSPGSDQAPKDGESQQGEHGKTVEEMLQDQGTTPVEEGNGDRDGKDPAQSTPGGDQAPKDGESQQEERGKTVEEMLQEQGTIPAEKEVNNVWYGRNPAVSSYLLIGVDKEDVVSQDDLIGGQCDLLELIVLDSAEKTYTVIQLNRDTMAEVEILDFEGDQTGVTTTQQICFAHTYGNGTEASCENVVRAVSRFLGGIEIHGYAALQYGAVPILNDALGGVTVTIEDDFSDYDPTLVQGETITLTGEQAIHFVRGRMSVGDGQNPGRMRRQRVYWNSYADRLAEELSGNSGIVDTIYNAAKPYMVTDMSLGAVSKLLATAMQYQDCGTVSPEGELQYVQYQNGNVYAEFYADPNALEQLTLDLFYIETNDTFGERET